MKKSKAMVIAAWVAVVLAISGALMLYPIGPQALNIAFVLIKVCMVTGLLVLVFAPAGAPVRGGFALWAVASVLAVVMTACKWATGPAAGAGDVFLYVGSMVVDLGMPALVYALSRKAR